MRTKAQRLRGNQFTTDPRLDRVRQVDLRDLEYPAVGRNGVISFRDSPPRSYTWKLDVFNDQGQEGACVGFGWGHELLARPVPIAGVDNTFSRESLYWEFQRRDEWEGGAYPGAKPMYEGTSVRAGAEYVKSLGYIDGYRWIFDVKELVLALGYLGPVVIGVDWYEGMFDADFEGAIRPTGNIRGGHCVCVVAARLFKLDPSKPMSWTNLDYTRSFVIIHNSWGPGWGVGGRAKMFLIDVAKLMSGGDFCVPVGRRRLKIPA